MSMLELINLSKKYSDFSLGPINLVLEPGTIHGLIGANGAGKTTMYRCIMGTVRCNKGTIKINGEVANESSGHWKQSIGYVGDYFPLIEHWSGGRNLKAFAPFYEKYSWETVEALASRFELNLDQSAKSYSTGQRAKLAIIHALSHDASFLLLDEPTSGLDPVARDTFMEVLYEQMQKEGLTILYATHYVSEIEQMADQLIIIDEGKILAQKFREDLEQFWRRITFRLDRDPGDLPDQISRKVLERDHEVISSNHESTVMYLEQTGAESIQSSRLTMEQICVQLLKHKAVK